MTREEQRLLDSIGLVCLVKAIAGIRPLHAVSTEVARGNYGATYMAAMALQAAGALRVGVTLNNSYFIPTHKQQYTMNEFEKTIKAHLDEVARKDAAFAAKYTPDAKDKKKDISACCAYIISQVKGSGRQGFTDEEVYGMAIHFYDEGLTAPAKVDGCKVIVNHEVKLSPEEEEQIRANARKEAEERIKRDELNKLSREREKARKREENAQKRAMARKAAEEEAKRKAREEWEKADMLFNFDEEDEA
ncbi:MAG: PcfK-like family protein [Bacteroidales bacterium]|nr:PcfK-like family protein [Bacteroidales bacterium]